MADRIPVLKTFKLYINGKFPRTESGRYYIQKDLKGNDMANVCLSSRKDLRNSVVAARKAQSAWEGRAAFNRGQILYRIAENLEGRKEEFGKLLQKEEGLSEKKALQRIEEAIDLIIYYAGWADKYQQIFSAVNPVSSSHFNFSACEAMGVVVLLSDEKANFLQLINLILASVCGGNTIVALASSNNASSAISFAEVLHHSDVPAGVINILTGNMNELLEHAANHMDVNAIVYMGKKEEERERIQELSAINLKRMISSEKEESGSPYLIKRFLEIKTAWHPIEQIGGSAPAY